MGTPAANTEQPKEDQTGLVSRKIATEAVEKWLNYKRIRPSARETNAEFIDQLSEYFMDGTLVLDEETHNIIQKLRFKIGNKEKLTYKPRILVGEINDRLSRLKSSDGSSKLTAYTVALTGENSAVIDKMDTEDNRVAQTITIFFL